MSSHCCGSGRGCCSAKSQEGEVNREGKLCQVCNDKFSVEAVSTFVKNPTHMCDCCGRVSNDPSKLCSPVDLEAK